MEMTGEAVTANEGGSGRSWIQMGERGVTLRLYILLILAGVLGLLSNLLTGHARAAARQLSCVAAGRRRAHAKSDSSGATRASDGRKSRGRVHGRSEAVQEFA